MIVAIHIDNGDLAEIKRLVSEAQQCDTSEEARRLKDRALSILLDGITA